VARDLGIIDSGSDFVEAADRIHDNFKRVARYSARQRGVGLESGARRVKAIQVGRRAEGIPRRDALSRTRQYFMAIPSKSKSFVGD